jgi:hypothetical protein
MANSVNPPVENEAASVQPTADVEIRLVCGDTGYVYAADSISFSRYKNLAPASGQIIVVSSSAGPIVVKKLGLDESHETELIVGKGAPDQMHIRIPAGVSFGKYAGSKPGYSSAFCYKTEAPQHNVLPLHFPAGQETGQSVQELVVVDTRVPPRASVIDPSDTEPIPKEGAKAE